MVVDEAPNVVIVERSSGKPSGDIESILSSSLGTENEVEALAAEVRQDDDDPQSKNSHAGNFEDVETSFSDESIDFDEVEEDDEELNNIQLLLIFANFIEAPVDRGATRSSSEMI